MKFITQQAGDRGKGYYTASCVAHTIPSNPMSDREQKIIEIYAFPNKHRAFGQSSALSPYGSPTRV